MNIVSSPVAVQIGPLRQKAAQPLGHIRLEWYWSATIWGVVCAFHTVTIMLALLVCMWLVPGGHSYAQSQRNDKILLPEIKSGRELLHRVRDSFKRMRSIHYTFQSTFSKFAPNRPARNNSTDGEFAFENGMYYSSFKVDASASEHGTVIARTAFDGLAHQWYENGELIVDSEIPERPYATLQPIIQPFLFAKTSAGRLTVEDIVNEEAWDEIGKHAQIETSEIVSGHPCDVISFSKPSGASNVVNVSWKIYAARDLGHYPIRITTSAGKIHSFSDVTAWRVVASRMGDVVIPVKIVSESRDGAGLLVQSMSFDVALKSVNLDLDDRLFSLKRFDPERTKYVDSDPNLRRETERGGWLQVVLAINVGVVVLLLLAVLMRRMKWKANAN